MSQFPKQNVMFTLNSEDLGKVQATVGRHIFDEGLENYGKLIDRRSGPCFSITMDHNRSQLMGDILSDGPIYCMFNSSHMSSRYGQRRDDIIRL